MTSEHKTMGTVELKLNICKIVDGIQNEQLLQTSYDFLKARETTRTGRHWNALSEEQKNEVLLSYEESEDEDNLVDSPAIKAS